MIITLVGADFSGEGKNIGTLTTWTIATILGEGATYNGAYIIDRGATLDTTVTLADGYEIGSDGVTVTVGGNAVTSGISQSGNVITINIASVTGNVMIKVPTKKVATGEEEEPETPTSYTLTINPDPDDATVILTATGYTQNGNSITVPNETTVSWSVSADGYTEQSGTWTANGSNESKNIKLVASSGSGEAYWVGEKLSGKAHGTGTASSYLGAQYYYITDEAAISELSGRTVDKMAFNFASKSGANTPTGTITVYLVNPSNSAPANWEAKAEIAVEAYSAGSQKEFDITPFTVPSGYTVGYRASKSSILGGGYMMQDYKFGGAFYETADGASKDSQLGGVDIHIQGT